MAMALRVVVPPHPLIGHWLAVLRDRHTPGPLYASATTELGRWLSYEALRDWLPHRSIQVDSPLAATEAEIVDFYRTAASVCAMLGVSLGDGGAGYRGITNAGGDGGQEVPHYHLHIVGGAPLGRMLSRG